MTSFFARLWDAWKELGSYSGNFQARVILTIFYFIIALPFGLITRLTMDPLQMRSRPATSAWSTRQPDPADVPSAQRQF
jgi:hypothetical protein